MPKRSKGGWKHRFNHWHIIFCCLVAVTVGIYYAAVLNCVTIQVDGKKIHKETFGETVTSVLKEANITLRQGDRVTPALNVNLTKGMKIRVERAFPVRIRTAEKSIEFRTVPRPVKEVLARANVKVDADDKVLPDLEQVVGPHQQIRVVRISSQIIRVSSTVKPGTEYLRDPKLERGVRKIISKGQEGLNVDEYRIVYEDGKQIHKDHLAEKMIRPMMNAVIALGIKRVVNTLFTSRGSYRYIEMKTMNASAYSPGPESCGTFAGAGFTYTGKKAGFGIVAVDPQIIPLGTMLYVEGYGKAEACDIGAAIRGPRIDLCFETYREAVMFGRKKVNVYILEK